jgi:RimJ/RimL family protein N-acetyltransferase
MEDRFDIMQWRNEQIYHLRQNNPLTAEMQDAYFSNVVSKLFDQQYPPQILFSYLRDGVCIGYGGLVHINWTDKNAEISFVMNTALENEYFEYHWVNYLNLIRRVAFDELDLHKIYTYAFDLRPHLYPAIEKAGLKKEATLKEHCYFNSEYRDVIIHALYNTALNYRSANDNDARLLFDWANDADVRINAFNSQSIEWEDHLQWLKRRFSDPGTEIFIFSEHDHPVGQVRLEATEAGYLIDYSVDRMHRGKGIGKSMIRQIMGMVGKRPLLARVKESNKASLSVFESLGFMKKSDDRSAYPGSITFILE